MVLTPSCTLVSLIQTSLGKERLEAREAPAPTAERILEIFKQVFGSGRKSDLRAVSEQDSRYLV